MTKEFYSELDILRDKVETDLIGELARVEEGNSGMDSDEVKIHYSKLEKIYEKLIDLEEQTESSQK